MLRSGDKHVTMSPPPPSPRTPALVRPEAAEVPMSAKTLIVMIGSYPDCHTRTRVTGRVPRVTCRVFICSDK